MSENLILASTSAYRVKLLAQLGIPFEQAAPDYTEITVANESPEQRSRRLAEGKAGSITLSVQSDDIILGSDQVAHMADGTLLHKPGGFDAAREQLLRCSGQWVSFTTGICLRSHSDTMVVDSETFRIRFRPLTETIIESYLRRDQPYDCAGSLKAEGLGITLIGETDGRDINTLYGLPLMLLSDYLINLNILL